MNTDSTLSSVADSNASAVRCPRRLQNSNGSSVVFTCGRKRSKTDTPSRHFLYKNGRTPSRVGEVLRQLRTAASAFALAPAVLQVCLLIVIKFLSEVSYCVETIYIFHVLLS